MTPPLGAQIDALVAGELGPEAAERLLAVIATSDAAAAELEACLQARAIGHALGAGRRSDLARARAARDRRWPRPIAVIAVVAPVAAAVVILLYVLVLRAPVRDDLDARFLAALSPHRRLEPRLSWRSADRHRPYDPARAGAQRAEPLPLELLAAIERNRDARAATAGALLAGNAKAAVDTLAHASETPDLLSDRAAVALVQGDPELAIIATAAALARAPGHQQALWNRALALQALGLDRSAAAAFDAVAERGEPGWSGEAGRQAVALHAWRTHHDAAWHEVAARGAAMVRGGPPPVDQVATSASAVRDYFYDAVRAAPSAERVRDLAPLAGALDLAAGGDALRRYVERVAAAPFGRRGALAARYAALVRGELDGAQRAGLIGELRAAHQDDLLLGALAAGSRGAAAPPVDAGAAGEYIRLAEATGDPWFELAAAEQRGAGAASRGDLAAAEATLHDAGERCDRSRLAYRCAAIWRRLAGVYEATRQTAAAGDALGHARRAARVAGAVPVEDELLSYAGAQAELCRAGIAGAHALSVAYLDERGRAAP